MKLVSSFVFRLRVFCSVRCRLLVFMSPIVVGICLMYMAHISQTFFPLYVYHLLHRDQEHALFDCDGLLSTELGIKINVSSHSLTCKLYRVFKINKRSPMLMFTLVRFYKLRFLL